MQNKRILLKRIQLQNWKSKNMDVTFSDKKTRISALNETGKTSIKNALCWILCGYTNPYSPKNHELFDNTKELSPETPIASAKVWLEIDGVEYTVEKTAKAKFTRRRGSNEYIKEASDTYRVLVDDIETSATDFTSWLGRNICNPDMIPYCLDGRFFTFLAGEDKRKARQILEVIVGEVKDEDFKGNYALLATDFAKGYTVEQIEDRAKNAIKPIRKRIDEIPTLIENKEAFIAGCMTRDFDATHKRLVEIRKAIADIDSTMMGIADSIQPIMGERHKMFDLINRKSYELNERRRAYENKHTNFVREIEDEIAKVESNNRKYDVFNYENKVAHETAIKTYETAQKCLDKLQLDIEELRRQRDELRDKVFDSCVCSFCGQPLPEELLENEKKQFLAKKSEKLAAIAEHGIALSREIEVQTKLVETLKEKAEKEPTNIEPIDVEPLKARLADVNKAYIRFEDTEEYKTLFCEIEDLKSSVPELPEMDDKALTEKKNELMQENEQLNQIIGIQVLMEQAKDEVADMKHELRLLGNDLAQLEGLLDTAKMYIEERADIISFKVNEKLDGCRIRMWDTQKNGERIPSCTITDEWGVKYSTLSGAATIITDIAVQKMFCTHFGVELPIFVDEASIFDSSHLPNGDTQMIYLFASEDKQLKVEYNG